MELYSANNFILMKFIFSFFIIAAAFKTFSQDLKYSVLIGDQGFVVSLDDDNKNKLLLINPAHFSNNDALTISVEGEEVKEWKYNFFIYDSTDNGIADFVQMKNDVYCIKFDALKKLLKAQQQYFIYTTAIPADPQKAMLVKPARRLVCIVKIQ